MIDSSDPPLLAIVVLSVGAAPELADAVRSVLDQGGPVEIVVVNSGGGDVAPLLPAAGRDIRVISVDEILWPGAARNRGIEATSAPFVAFLAADCTAQPGWVAARLRRHLRGAPAVASAIVNNDPDNAVATAYHLVHTGTRDVRIPPARAMRYGASYARWMFDRYGLFREDMRVAEDSEFHQRLLREHRPVWAPDVRTVHRNPTHLWPALRQHFARGRNNGLYWAERARRRFIHRTRKAVAASLSDLDQLIPKPHPAGRAWMRLVITMLVLANQLGRTAGRRRASPAVRVEAIARAHIRAGRWRRAARKWGEAAALRSDAPGPLRAQAAALANAGDHAGAVKVHRGLSARYPDDCSVQIGLAHALLAGGSFSEALDTWHALAARFGRRLPIVEGLALTQLARDDRTAAEQLFAELSETFPESPTGVLGRAEAALAKQDWEVALGQLRALGQRHGNVVALERAAEISTYLGRDRDADEVLELLRTADAEGVSYLSARLGTLTSRNDWSGVDGVLERYRADIVSGPSLLAPMVDALNMAGQSERALQLIADAAAISSRRYQGLRLATHLHVGQTETALKVFAELPEVRSLSVSSFTALAAAAYDDRGAEAAAALVGGAARSASRPALRFAAVFQGCRLESLAGLERGPPSLAVEDGSCEARLARVLDGLPGPSDPQSDIVLLKDHCSVFARLRATRADFAPDPSFVAADAVKVAAAIASAVGEERAFSLVRLGDGEGNMLPYREPYARYRGTDYAATQRVWWGRAEDAAGDLEAQLRRAIDSADVVGMPDLFRLSYVSSYAVLQGASGRSRNVRGLLAAFDYGAHLPEALLTSCHVHQALGHWGMWDILLPQLGTVSLVTCHEGLGAALAQQFGIEISATHLIPPEFKHASKFTDVSAGRHYPDVFESLREPLSKVPKGRVVLVAAGMLGKIYCDWIKSAGGIALDVGSAADHWCGYNTRPAHETVAYRTPRGVRARIEELAKTDPLVASIVHLRG